MCLFCHLKFSTKLGTTSVWCGWVRGGQNKRGERRSCAGLFLVYLRCTTTTSSGKMIWRAAPLKEEFLFIISIFSKFRLVELLERLRTPLLFMGESFCPQTIQELALWEWWHHWLIIRKELRQWNLTIQLRCRRTGEYLTKKIQNCYLSGLLFLYN